MLAPLAPIALLASSPSATRSTPAEGRTFRSVLMMLGSQVDRGENSIDAALVGPATRDPAALIALQARIYRYTETIDLAAKLVDSTTSALRTTLQSG